jgi:uncharacterized protein (TIGR02996 family)
MRTFEFSDAKSHKFWNVAVDGTSFTVTYGKIGTAGQTQTKSFPTPEKAQAEADKLVREKTGKGYVETTPKAAESDAEKFEAALRANPDDLAGWSAFADYLAEQDDPRGELMQVQLALADESLKAAERKKLAKREEELLKKLKRLLLGEFADFKKTDGVTVTVANGWIRAIRFKRLTVNQARALAKEPAARLLRELIVEDCAAEAPVGGGDQYADSFYEPGPDVPDDVEEFDGPSLHALSRCPYLKNLRVFQLGERLAPKDEQYMNCHTPGELAFHLVKQMPNLEELHLLAHHVGAKWIFPLPMPNLRALTLYHSNSYPLEKLAANKTLTNLTTLLTHPHAIDFEDDQDTAYIRFAQLKAICRSPHLKSLTHLQLRLTDFGDKGAKEVVESGILKRLKVLDVRGGSMTDAGAKVLADCPDTKNLERLNLASNALTKDGVKLIKGLGVASVDVATQHAMQGEDFGSDELPEYLFDGDIE